MASLSLKHIYKVYDGGVKAVNDFCMEIEDKEFIVFVGPSGCGKSTTLRMIAGLEDITAGELRIDNEVVNDFEPKDRNIAMVFQNYALYPHMSVYENLAFSLRTMHMPNDEIHEKVMEAARILGITEYLDRKPKALSGGQRQRVALGRAIVRNPKVFLLDEPLSNLDAKLRAAMRAEISRLHEKLQTTFIYVTHDQVEAMTMGTRIVVMKAGYIQQIDTPINLYLYPDNMFVAGFIGTPQMNFFDAVIEKDGPDVTFRLACGVDLSMTYQQVDKIPVKYMDGAHPVVFGIRPDGVKIDDGTLDDTQWAKTRAVVSVVEVLGGETLIYANLNTETPDAKDGSVIIKADPDVFVKRGDIIRVGISKKKFHCFDKETEMSIRRRIPKENMCKCTLRGGQLCFAGQSITLPSALATHEVEGGELTMPVSALHLGEGEGRANIQWIEEIQGKTLYFLTVGDLTMFSLEAGSPRYQVGEDVPFSIDMRDISIPEAGILPLQRENHIPGVFTRIKEKVGERKVYQFYMQMGDQLILASIANCEKLFACKGTKIFQTPLEYVIDAEHIVCDTEEAPLHALRGTVLEVLDYGIASYARVCIEGLPGQTAIVPYSGPADAIVNLYLDQNHLTIKDSKLDIIIL